MLKPKLLVPSSVVGTECPVSVEMERKSSHNISSDAKSQGPANAPAQAEQRLLRLAEVLARIGMRRSWLYKEMAAGRFPQCIKVGRASAWGSDVIAAYIAAAVAGKVAQATD